MSNPSDQGMLPDHVRNDTPPEHRPEDPNADTIDASAAPDDPAAEHIDPDLDPRPARDDEDEVG